MADIEPGEIERLAMKLTKIKEVSLSEYHYILGFVDCLVRTESEIGKKPKKSVPAKTIKGEEQKWQIVDFSIKETKG